MSKRLQQLLIVMAVIGIVAVLATVLLGREQMLAALFGPIELTRIDFKTLSLPERPNQYLVCPRDHCAAKPHAESPVYNLSVADLKERWLAMLARQPRIQQLSVSADGLQYDVIQRSLVIRFPDSITVRFLALGETRSALAIYSRSQYGYFDFGANRRRVTAWLEALQASS